MRTWAVCWVQIQFPLHAECICCQCSCLCISIVGLCMTTLTEGFPCFFLSCKANARVKPAKTRQGPHSSQICVVLYIVRFVSFCVLFACICVLYYCHRVATQLQLTNISIYLKVNACLSLENGEQLKVQLHIWSIEMCCSGQRCRPRQMSFQQGVG